MTNKNPHIRLAGGQVFELLNPDPTLIDYRTMVNALAKECRYGNRCENHYSVAQHSVLCASLALTYWPGNYHAAMCALMHDCSEYLLSDCVTTVKNATFFRDYDRDRYLSFDEVESGLSACISQALNVPVWDDETTHLLDLTLRCREMLDLTDIDPAPHYPDYMERAQVIPPVHGWDWQTSALKFHGRFCFLAAKLDLEPLQCQITRT